MAILVPILVLILLASVGLAFYFFYYRKRIRSHHQLKKNESSVELFDVKKTGSNANSLSMNSSNSVVASARILTNIQIIKLLGEGQFGQVYKGRRIAIDLIPRYQLIFRTYVYIYIY